MSSALKILNLRLQRNTMSKPRGAPLMGLLIKHTGFRAVYFQEHT